MDRRCPIPASGLTCARRFGPEPDLHRPVSSTQCHATATSRGTPSQGQRRDPNTPTYTASIASKRAPYGCSLSSSDLICRGAINGEHQGLEQLAAFSIL